MVIASPMLQHMSARQLVALYSRRMQIDSSFRDLKSHRYGHGLEDSLTGKRHRLDILLLVNAPATFASWLAELACETTGIDHWLYPGRKARKLYSHPNRTRSPAAQLAHGTGLELDKAVANPTGNRARSDAGSLMKNVGIPQGRVHLLNSRHLCLGSWEVT
ncbi:hypothetical protein GGR77_003842 [Xanthomonas translucens]